ncbi:S8 family peptidase [Kurthia senegalensis]|uniref:S8 family peptidase n=1 Tax=Kurthia senegalensis TaxID=1033740 RepID=UPI0002887709|nr:S8 family peptidase [Kurthia senegalensis]
MNEAVKRIVQLSFISLVLMGCFGWSNQVADAADRVTILKAPELLVYVPMQGQLKAGETQWYQVFPSTNVTSTYSHIRFTVNSKQTVTVKVYSSADRAMDDFVYESYVTATIHKKSGTIDFPLAWNGPYYIEVSYNGEEGQANASANYTLQASLEKLSPETTNEATLICPVESSTQGKSNASVLLKDIRLFRDGTLAKTAEGQELSSLYYKASPFVVKQLVKQRGLKDDLYTQLLILQPLIEEVNTKSFDSTYVINEEESDAISSLYDMVYESVPKRLKQQLQQSADELNMEAGFEGEALSDVLVRATGLVVQPNVSSKVIVKMKDGQSIQSVQKQVDAQKNLDIKSTSALGHSGLDNTYVLEMTEDASDVVSLLEDNSKIAYVEPVKTYENFSNDIQYKYQWALENTGAEGLFAADIQYTKMQKITNRLFMDETKIAVLDTGVDNTLADLSNVVLMNEGRNYIDRNEPAMDDHGHGTHVAGIIAAEANNGYSMEGINQYTKILPIKVLDADGAGNNENIALGIIYAVNQGADVINLSLGGSYSRTLESALKYAYDNKVAVVVASGNDGLQGLSYPASSKYVISVGATNALDVVADYSNYGKKLDIVAPGTNIPSLVPNGNVTYLSGTSMAAPHVAAVAGLVKSIYPTITNSNLKKLLQQTTKTIAFTQKDTDNQQTTTKDLYNLVGVGNGEVETDSGKLAVGKDLVSGYGRLNGENVLQAAVLRALVDPVKPTSKIVTGYAAKGASVTVKSGKKVIGKTTMKKTGKYTVKIPTQKQKQKLVVTVQKGKSYTANLAVYVAK